MVNLEQWIKQHTYYSKRLCKYSSQELATMAGVTPDAMDRALIAERYKYINRDGKTYFYLQLSRSSFKRVSRISRIPPGRVYG